ncbi:MAG: hypothetical protein IBX71_09280 [Candidatus Desulforudis sp.]|nr:hypothetical protein [Desulforudis sp.]
MRVARRVLPPGHGQRGVTFVEALIAALLLVTVLFAALGLYERGVFTWSRGEKAMDLQDQLRLALDRLSGDIRNARELIYLTGPPAEISAGETVETTDLIELVLPKRNAPTEVETVHYSWAPAGVGDTRHVLRRQDEGSGGPQPVAHRLTYVCISAKGPQLVEVKLRATAEHRGRPVETEAEGVYYIRAPR